MGSTFDLGEYVFVETLSSDGLLYVDIRRWGVDGKPTKKGIRLTPESWQILLGVNEQLVADIHNVLTERKWVKKWYPIGEDTYVFITSHWPSIDVYQWYIDEYGLLQPSKKGISLKFHQWKRLMELSTEIGESMPDIDHMS